MEVQPSPVRVIATVHQVESFSRAFVSRLASLWSISSRLLRQTVFALRFLLEIPFKALPEVPTPVVNEYIQEGTVPILRARRPP